MANLFKAATAVKAPAEKKTARKEKVQHKIQGAEAVAQLDMLIKALTAAKDNIAATVKDEGFNIYHEKGMAGKAEIESFVAVEGKATVGVECRKRSSASALTADECEVLEANKLPYGQEVQIPFLYGINPTYAADDTMLQKVSDALQGIVPDDFIFVQEEVKKNVVTDATLVSAYHNGVPASVLKMITVMALKPKLEDANVADLLEAVKPLLVDAE